MQAPGYRDGKPFDLQLVEVQPDKYLCAEAAIDFLHMEAAAQKAGFPLHLNSAFREMGHQEHLYQRYLVEYSEWEALVKAGKLTAEEAKNQKPMPVARPGYSNHQSGDAVDIQRADVPGLDKWLAENAAKFSFFRTVAVEMHHWEHKRRA